MEINKESMEKVNERKDIMYEEMKSRVFDMLEEYTDDRFKINFSANREYTYDRDKNNKRKSYINFRTEINFLDDNDKEIFGSGFTIYWENGRLEMNHGCMGQFNYDSKGQVARCIMMGKIWDDEYYVDGRLYIESCLEELDLEYKDEYLEILTIQSEYYENVEKERREQSFLTWLEEYKTKLSNMHESELKLEKRRKRASAKKYNGIEPRVLIAIEEEVVKRIERKLGE